MYECEPISIKTLNVLLLDYLATLGLALKSSLSLSIFFTLWHKDFKYPFDSLLIYELNNIKLFNSWIINLNI